MNYIFLIYFLFISSAFAEYHENIVNGCKYVENHELIATFEINKYTCNTGEFLPANTLGCKKCSTDHVCVGGVFEYNKTKSSGVEYKTLSTNSKFACAANFPATMQAVFTPNVHECLRGYYMPANTDGCVVCPENNYCVGGTYTFNETIAQGITICPENAPFAPIGMWTKLQCGRKLHIDDDVLYVHQEPANPTEHRLYIRVNDTVYSANATPKQNSSITKTSINATQLLHIVMDGIEYLIHDDSVK